MKEKLFGHPDTHPLPDDPIERKKVEANVDKKHDEALERYRARKAKEEAEKNTTAVDKTVKE